ncbi:MAG: endospore germination permease [Syntrophomonadaceae bacterium]|nr:endospore germination permease [Syntrophomonadaceae bacterium]
MDARFVITSKQLMFILIGTQIATGIFSLPRVVTADAGVHGWLAIILAVIPSTISILLIVNVGKKFPDKNIVELTQYLFGKPIGIMITIFTISYIAILQGIVIRIFAEITSLYMLPNTPTSVIIFLVLMPVIYAVIQGGKVVGRLNELLFYFLLLILLLPFAALVHADITNILPLGAVDIKGLLKGVLSASFAFAGVELLFVTYFMVNNKEKVLKYALASQLIVLVIYLSLVVLCLLVFGNYAMKQMLWPLLTLIKVIEVPVFERLEIFFLAFWLGLGVRPVINNGLAISYSVAKLFNANFTTYKLIVLLLGILLYIGASIPENKLEAKKWSEYAGYANLVIILIYPLIYNLMSLFRK